MAETRKPKSKSRASQARKPSSAGRPAGRSRRDATPVLEWIAAGVGLVALAGAIGMVASAALGPDRSAPAVVVERLSVVETDAGYLVRIRAVNRGGSAAAQVVVDGKLDTGSGEPETAEATFDFIADHSSRDGGLYFEGDPRTGTLVLRAKGYTAP